MNEEQSKSRRLGANIDSVSGTVLIVDDESIVRETLKRLLEGEGYDLAFARNGVEALTRAAELTPDLILLDVVMPGMTGFEVCQHLRRDRLLAEVPIVIVTALRDRHSRLQGIEAGADDFIAKPFDEIELRAKVRTIVRLSRYRRLLLEQTRRQQAEESLRESERKFREFVEGTDDLVTQVDGEGRFTYVNHVAERIFGLKPEDCIGLSVFSFTHPDDRAAAEHSFAQWVRDRVPSVTFENRLVSHSGEVHEMLWTINPHFDAAGNVVIINSIARDITERKQQVQRHAEELEQRVADRTRGLLALYEVTAIASQTLNLETALDRSLGRVLVAMRSDAGAIHLLDEANGASGGEMLRLAVQQGFPPDLVAQLDPVPMGSSLVGRVIVHGEPLIVSDITSDPRMAVASRTAPRTYVGVPMRTGGQAMGVLSVLREVAQAGFSEEEVTLLASLADQVGVLVTSTRLRQLAEQAAVVDERQRLARDLHDSVTQSLFSMTLTAEAARILLERNPARVSAQLDRLRELAKGALAEMRSLIYQLRPRTADQAGLVPALRQHIAERQEQDGLKVALRVEGKRRLPPEHEEALFRIVQEGLNNVVKHAQTDRVEVTLRLTDETANLLIEDYGTGFDPLATLETGPPSIRSGASRFGLASMRERAEMLGGSCTIESQPGAGTLVKVELPHM